MDSQALAQLALQRSQQGAPSLFASAPAPAPAPEAAPASAAPAPATAAPAPVPSPEAPAATPGAGAAPLPAPDAPAPAAAPAAEPAPAPAAPATPEPTDPTARRDAALNSQVDALQQTADVKSQKAQEQAPLVEERNKQITALGKKLDADMRTQDTAAVEAQQAIARADKSLRDLPPVAPKLETGQKVLGMLALAFGAFGSEGGIQQALAGIDRMKQESVERQKAEFDKFSADRQRADEALGRANEQQVHATTMDLKLKANVDRQYADAMEQMNLKYLPQEAQLAVQQEIAKLRQGAAEKDQAAAAHQAEYQAKLKQDDINNRRTVGASYYATKTARDTQLADMALRTQIHREQMATQLQAAQVKAGLGQLNVGDRVAGDVTVQDPKVFGSLNETQKTKLTDGMLGYRKRMDALKLARERVDAFEQNALWVKGKRVWDASAPEALKSDDGKLLDGALSGLVPVLGQGLGSMDRGLTDNVESRLAKTRDPVLLRKVLDDLEAQSVRAAQMEAKGYGVALPVSGEDGRNAFNAEDKGG